MIEFFIQNAFWISQFFGLIASVCMVTSYFQRNRMPFLVMQSCGNFATVLSFFMLGQFFASIGCGIATVRMVTFALIERKGKEIPWWLVFVFMGLTVISCVILWAGWLDVLFMVGLLIFTLSLKVKNIQTVRCILIAPSVMFAIKSLCSGAYTVLVSNVFELCALVMSVVAYRIVKPDDKTDEIIKEERIAG